MVTQRQEEKIVFSQGKESLLVASVNEKNAGVKRQASLC